MCHLKLAMAVHKEQHPRSPFDFFHTKLFYVKEITQNLRQLLTCVSVLSTTPFNNIKE